MGGMFSPPKMPEPLPPPPPPPQMMDPAIQAARQQAIAQAKRRSTRNATLLTRPGMTNTVPTLSRPTLLGGSRSTLGTLGSRGT